MAKPLVIARQSSAPKGFFGRILLGFMGRETKRFNADVLARLEVSEGDRVLEVGFGHGRTIDAAAGAVSGATFAGIDISADALRVAQRRCRRWIAAGRVELLTGDAAALPWGDESFSKALTVHTIYFWIEEPRPTEHPQRLDARSCTEPRPAPAGRVRGLARSTSPAIIGCAAQRLTRVHERLAVHVLVEDRKQREVTEPRVDKQL
jgi:SAM-dependent methyltransferase